jgi:hypothetical protein
MHKRTRFSSAKAKFKPVSDFFGDGTSSGKTGAASHATAYPDLNGSDGLKKFARDARRLDSRSGWIATGRSSSGCFRLWEAPSQPFPAEVCSGFSACAETAGDPESLVILS